jgi:hypothetical protein
MKYNLQFIKISPEHQFAGVGFAGNIFITLNALTHIGQEDKLFVDMETNECVCTENGPIIHETKNCWEYYFEQTKLDKSEDFITMNSLISAKINYDDREMFMYPENFLELKEKFYNSFQLKPYLKEILKEYYINNIEGKITLGVQVRLTDMKHYHNVSGIEKYINKINEILNEKPEIQQIFLATDDGTIIKNIKESFNIPVLYYEDMFRADEKNPHLHPYDRFIETRDLHKYKLGIECIQEIFTLAKCDYLLKADVSSVSIIASILSENIKKVYRV